MKWHVLYDADKKHYFVINHNEPRAAIISESKEKAIHIALFLQNMELESRVIRLPKKLMRALLK